ncbi:sodium:calcium antiporter [Persephonella atlantica]|uniref:Sodium:calcium antiporter n=1 Tax=Persephonella atlantica TaxID=2699429 RepID=A0ABS1GJ87_9AQUI|nr:sodium:calcium antiporter [Persephonella atlantica]MBK3332994.1 sodium:calcium antiporter [Persephonella atlantica]
MLFDIIIFLLGLIFILISAEVFTNGVEALGHRLNLSTNFTGSVLAAVGTALPETILPVIAVLFFAEGQGHDIGVGAILGAPFMLSTLAFPLIGLTVILAHFWLKKRALEINIETVGFRRDIVFFLFAYSVALFIVPYENEVLRVLTAVFLILLYVLYIWLTLKGESNEMEEVEKLYFSPKNPNPHIAVIILQVITALTIMITGAHMFVSGIEKISLHFGFPALLFSLLVAPVATELPEKVNSIFWILRKKDSLAVGNVSGAMVFQSTIPVGFGIVFTQWDITGLAMVSGVFAVVSAFFALALSYVDKKVIPFGLTIGGIFYIIYIYLAVKEFF